MEKPARDARADLIAPLTGIRGYAALWVVLYHMRSGLDVLLQGHDSMRSIVSVGFLGVDLFAVLSGFIISLTYAERLSQPSRKIVLSFLWLRLARIYPLLLVVLGFFVGAGVWRKGPNDLGTTLADPSFWMQALMLNGWGFESRWVYNVPSWTVSSEWLCYLVFPLLAPLLMRVRDGRLALGLAGLTIGATILAMHAVGHPYFDAHLDFGWLRIAGEFLTGCWLYRALSARTMNPLPWGWIGLGALALAFYSCTNAQHWLTVTCFVVLVYALAQNREPLRSIFGNRVSVFLGEISYSVYLVHWFVLSELMPVVEPQLSHVALSGKLALVLGAILLLATLTHFTVERPARARMRQWIEN
jgi:peptidoglycan/LPS O-acetylase OafA/YrhL